MIASTGLWWAVIGVDALMKFDTMMGETFVGTRLIASPPAHLHTRQTGGDAINRVPTKLTIIRILTTHLVQLIFVSTKTG